MFVYLCVYLFCVCVHDNSKNCVSISMKFCKSIDYWFEHTPGRDKFRPPPPEWPHTQVWLWVTKFDILIHLGRGKFLRGRPNPKPTGQGPREPKSLISLICGGDMSGPSDLQFFSACASEFQLSAPPSASSLAAVPPRTVWHSGTALPRLSETGR